jgi:hypothetical protein
MDEYQVTSASNLHSPVEQHQRRMIPSVVAGTSNGLSAMQPPPGSALNQLYGQLPVPRYAPPTPGISLTVPRY